MGQVTCEDGQVAICTVKDGKVDAQCKTPPSSSSEGPALRAWLLSEILQRPIKLTDLASPELQTILTEGKYANPHSGVVVYFTLPRGK